MQASQWGERQHASSLVPDLICYSGSPDPHQCLYRSGMKETPEGKVIPLCLVVRWGMGFSVLETNSGVGAAFWPYYIT